MSDSAPTHERVRFGCFEVDLRSSELRKQGFKIKLQEKPFQVLAILLEHAGEVVTREELRQRLWPADTFVDFDANLNTALNKLRLALGDSAENPRFVRTIPRRGYCFISPVGPAGAHAEPAQPPGTSLIPRAEQPSPRLHSAAGQFLRTRRMVAALALLGVALGLAILHFLSPGSHSSTNSHSRRMMLLVLPFENLSGDAEQQYFSAGLTEEMAARLGRLDARKLGIIAHPSAAASHDRRRDLVAIARELGVDYVLEGSVRRSKGRVRITARLIHAHDLTDLWAESYERDAADVLSIQRDVADRIAQSLALELFPAGTTPAAESSAVNPEAYDAYLKGRFHWNKRTEYGLRTALKYFREAIRKDPNYAPAYAGLADTYVVSASWVLMPPKEAYSKAKEAAAKALELNSSLAEAHASRAAVAWEYERDIPRAEQEFEKAIEINPQYATAHQWYAELFSALGRHDEAIAEMRRALHLEPLSLIINVDFGSTFYFARRYDQAIAAFKKTLEMDPNFPPAHVFLEWAYVEKGMYKEALAERQTSMLLAGLDPSLIRDFGRAFERGGIASARRWLIALRERQARNCYLSPYGDAVLYAGIGDHARALASLRQAFEQGDPRLDVIAVDPKLDPLRSDPGFRDLLRRLGLLS